jgi:hypothetical protein
MPERFPMSRPEFKYTCSLAEFRAGMPSDEYIRRYEAWCFGLTIEDYRARIAAGQRLFTNLRN